jgi:hypothetical protein
MMQKEVEVTVEKAIQEALRFLEVRYKSAGGTIKYLNLALCRIREQHPEVAKEIL